MNKKKKEVITQKEQDDDLDWFDKELQKEYDDCIKTRKRKKYFKDPNLIGYRRRFCEQLHQKYDIPARIKLKEVFGDYLLENPDKYGQDFIINSKTCKYEFLEVQVCSSWLAGYPFDKVWIYERKSIYKYDDKTLFLTLNKRLTKGFIFDIASIKDVKPRRLRKYSREFVYDIPWNRVLKVYLDTVDKETIEYY